MSLEYLPVELCAMIIQKLANNYDLKNVSSIARTCGYLHSIANPILYKWNIQHGDASALRWAVRQNKVNTLRRLVENGASAGKLISGQTPLMMATVSQSVDIVRYLLTLPGVDCNWAEPDGTTALQYAVRYNATEIVRLLLDCEDVLVDIKSNAGYTALAFTATESTYPFMADLLLVRGANPDSRTNRGESPLCLAVAHGNQELAKLLLNTKRVDINVVPEDGFPPLVSAVYWGNRDMLRILLSHSDINVNIAPKTGQRKDQTAINLAVEKERIDLVRILLQNPNTDPDIKDKSGKTAVMRAAKNRDSILVSMLLADSRVGRESRRWVENRYGITK